MEARLTQSARQGVEMPLRFYISETVGLPTFSPGMISMTGGLTKNLV